MSFLVVVGAKEAVGTPKGLKGSMKALTVVGMERQGLVMKQMGLEVGVKEALMAD